MIRIDDKKACVGCSACVSACPRRCIHMHPDDEGFLYPSVEEALCVGCGLCERVCPLLAKKNDEKKEPSVYGAYTKDTEIRRKSSSGGLFYELAAEVIRSGGAVFGAAFDESLTLRHTPAESLEALLPLMGSKYVQSEIGNAYQTAKALLDEGRTVLFTGTPCQISGLLSFLPRVYDNLICQDIICHGVPSPMALRRYVDCREEENGSLSSFSFRDKRLGWHRYGYAQTFANGSERFSPASCDSFGKAFSKNLCLRPACYTCAFKGVGRQSDITLADFWGVQHIEPMMDDDGGTSLIFLHSPKGRAIFLRIADRLVFRPVSLEGALLYNQSMVKSAEEPPKRAAFLSEIKSGNFDVLCRRYTTPPLYKQLIIKAKSLFKKLIKK